MTIKTTIRPAAAAAIHLNAMSAAREPGFGITLGVEGKVLIRNGGGRRATLRPHFSPWSILDAIHPFNDSLDDQVWQGGVIQTRCVFFTIGIGPL